MKSVLMSIKPKYCELIAKGEKTIEVRKSMPKLKTPFKCYIYMTKSNLVGDRKAYKDRMAGKVIGEFVCDKIDEIHISTELMYEKEVTGFSERTLNILNQSCLSYDEIIKYSGFTLDNYNAQKEYLYAWHISNLIIYDEPKELYEFEKPCPYDEECVLCKYYRNGGIYAPPYCDWDEFKLTRPPQSWCYVNMS